MAKKRLSNDTPATQEAGEQVAATAVEPGEVSEPAAPASNTSVLLLSGGFIAAMVIVVAAEFLRHQFM